MKEKFLWCQTSKVRVLHKPTTFRTIVIFCEMWQCTTNETKWDPLALNILLSNTSSHL
uniref:Similar to NRPB1 (RNA POLYMERASE II LARGE SUBUNIT) n=1 Tax=Arundo donax TaxID=35708 RepID=A0A0A9ECD3_ARUDO